MVWEEIAMKQTTSITVSLDGETKEKLRLLAQLDHRSLSGQVRHLIRVCIRTYEKEHGPISVQRL